jgi:hypothetical protein
MYWSPTFIKIVSSPSIQRKLPFANINKIISFESTTHTPNRFDEAAEMASPENSNEKLAFSVVFARCSTAFATKPFEIQAPSTLIRVNVKTHMQ